jgi:hypothetical protein
MRDLDHPISCWGKNTISWHAKKGELQQAFPLGVLMVPSSVLTIATDGERLSCHVFSLGETICFGSLEFITDRFDSLSLSPMGVVQMPSSWAQHVVDHHPCRSP